jgi:HEAT repeat protein
VKGVSELAEKQSFAHIDLRTAEHERSLAIEGFGLLGDEAECAVPALVDLYSRSGDPSFRETVSTALGKLGPAAKGAVPALIKGLTDTDSTVRESAAYALLQIRSQPELAVPALVVALRDPVQAVRLQAIVALTVLRPQARAALVVPALTQALADPDEWIRANAVEGLGRFKTNAWAAVPALTELYLKEKRQAPDPSPAKPNTLAILEWSLKQIDPTAASRLGIE